MLLNGNILEALLSKAKAYRSLLLNERAADECYNITESETAIDTITKIKDAVSDGSVLTCLDNLEVKFVPTPEISLGHIEEPTGWRLVKKIDLPKDMVDMMSACIALSDRRVAVGY